MSVCLSDPSKYLPHAPLRRLPGVEIIGNGSASHHQLRKLDTRIDLIVGATAKCGGVYLYANQCGCDGGRLYFDGSSLIVANGKVRPGTQAARPLHASSCALTLSPP